MKIIKNARFFALWSVFRFPAPPNQHDSESCYKQHLEKSKCDGVHFVNGLRIEDIRESLKTIE